MAGFQEKIEKWVKEAWRYLPHPHASQLTYHSGRRLKSHSSFIARAPSRHGAAARPCCVSKVAGKQVRRMLALYEVSFSSLLRT